MGVSILNDLNVKFVEISNLKAVWEELLKVTRNPSPFITYGWFFALSKHLLKKDIKIMVFYRNGKPVGILPSEIKDKTLFLIGDERVTDINGIILDCRYSGEIIEFIADFIMEKDLKVELYPLDSESELMEFLPGMLKIKTPEKATPFFVLKLPSSREEYLGSLSSKKRHEIRRKGRKLKGAEIKNLKAKDINKLFELMESSSRDKKGFLSKEMKAFFREIALYFEGIGSLRFKACYYKAKILAGLFCFQMKDTVYAFNTAYNPDFYKLSPGVVSFALDIDEAINESFACYNFLRGEERFKSDLGARRDYTWKIKR
ncbi:MAG: GNAT family N-acetyltransferase [candidate division WOR-3 bacterium]